MPLSGIGLAYATAGGILLWSGVKGETLAQTVGELARGQQPTGTDTQAVTVPSAPSSATSAGGGGGSVGPPANGAKYSYGQLKTLWILAGGSASLAPTMAAIALAESGGASNAHNPSGASGLWQIEIPVNAQYVPGGATNVYNPLANARAAVGVERVQGLGAWVTYTSGAYRQYLQG
jgi:Lysozyme like domain